MYIGSTSRKYTVSEASIFDSGRRGHRRRSCCWGADGQDIAPQRGPAGRSHGAHDPTTPIAEEKGGHDHRRADRRGSVRTTVHLHLHALAGSRCVLAARAVPLLHRRAVLSVGGRRPANLETLFWALPGGSSSDSSDGSRRSYSVWSCCSASDSSAQLSRATSSSASRSLPKRYRAQPGRQLMPMA